jgi:hypothetical protein
MKKSCARAGAVLFGMMMVLGVTARPANAQAACSPLVAGGIAGIVFEDVNGDGVRQAGEPGVNGVQVSITGPNSLSLVLTSGGASSIPGFYASPPLCDSGTYTVEVLSGPGLNGYQVTTTNPRVVTLNFIPSVDPDGNTILVLEKKRTVDFAVTKKVCTGSIGDWVWEDTNANGIQDEDERGIAGVTVRLRQGGAVVATTATDENGFYSFVVACNEDYQVEVETPAGFTASPANVGDPATDSDASGVLVAMGADDHRTDVDFGFTRLCLGTIGDFVWLDANRNGVQDAGEAGIEGVEVQLLLDGIVIRTAITSQNGAYLFEGICAGDYQVRIVPSTLPNGYAPTVTSPPAGGTAANDSNPHPSSVTLVGFTSSDLTIDFGFVGKCGGRIGDFVWSDVNGNGIQDAGEPGIGGVRVTLYAQSAPNMALASVTTTDNGAYLFEGLCLGDYIVEVDPTTLPAGIAWSPSPEDQGSNDAADSDGGADHRAAVSLPAPNPQNLTIDFGYVYPPQLGDFVWEDVNGNGQQDPDEPGIGGVPVALYRCGGATADRTTVTDADGSYLFDNLVAGVCYEVAFGAPAGFVFTLRDTGPDDSDSDASRTTGRTGGYTLGHGEANLTVDAGLYRPAALGDFIWIDTNGNGIQDAGEAEGVAGAVATLYVCDGSAIGSPVAGVSPQIVGTSGFYLFANLAPGSYAVRFTLPAGYGLTLQDRGADDARDSDANPATGFSSCVTLPSGSSNLTVDAGAVVNVPVCVPSTVYFTGSSGVTGTRGNIRQFSAPGVQIRVSAFSLTKSSYPEWDRAYLGAYSHGLGVTNENESGYSDTHVADNDGRNDFVLFEFSTPVIVTKAYLDYVGADSDITVWVGEFNNPYANHLSLSDAVLASFGLRDTSDTTSGSARWAEFNDGQVSGNAIVIAPRFEHGNDSFKLRKLELCVPQAAKSAIGDFVWHDQNGNGVQDSTEPGIDGATVKLLDGNGTVVATTTTGDDPHTGGVQKGYYEFTGLTPGATYRVEFVRPDGYDSTSPRQVGSDRSKDSDGAVSDAVVLAPGEFNRSIDAGFFSAPQGCVAVTLHFTGSSATYGSYGNIRTFNFSGAGLTVKVSAFSRKKSYATWNTAYLGAFSYGLGVTDSAEGSGGSNRHLVDNYDRNNYVLFEFSQPVRVDYAYLDYVQNDSDINVWFGQNPLGNNPFWNHITLSDSALNQFSVKESDTTSSGNARWARINGGGAAGNALVIAAKTDQTNDAFKLRKLVVCK